MLRSEHPTDAVPAQTCSIRAGSDSKLPSRPDVALLELLSRAAGERGQLRLRGSRVTDPPPYRDGGSLPASHFAQSRDKIKKK